MTQNSVVIKVKFDKFYYIKNFINFNKKTTVNQMINLKKVFTIHVTIKKISHL